MPLASWQVSLTNHAVSVLVFVLGFAGGIWKNLDNYLLQNARWIMVFRWHLSFRCGFGVSPSCKRDIFANIICLGIWREQDRFGIDNVLQQDHNSKVIVKPKVI